MKKIIISLTILLLVLFVQTAPTVVLASETTDTHIYEEDISIINTMAFKYIEIGQSLTFADGERSMFIDMLIIGSNEGFFLHLYDLIYQEEPKFMTEPKADMEITDIYYLYDMAEERRLHINRLLVDGYISEEDVSKVELTKSDVANILYNIYKNVLPYQGSVSYTDTDEVAVLWAAERSMPYFLNRSGYEIYPDQKQYTNYLDCLRYAALYFPNPVTKEYLPLTDYYPGAELQISDNPNDVISFDKAIKIIGQIRKEVAKPRLGYWKRDVLNNPKMQDVVNKYQNTKSNKYLKTIQQHLKEEFNLLEYQDDPAYIRYMFKLFS